MHVQVRPSVTNENRSAAQDRLAVLGDTLGIIQAELPGANAVLGPRQDLAARSIQRALLCSIPGQVLAAAHCCATGVLSGIPEGMPAAC